MDPQPSEYIMKKLIHSGMVVCALLLISSCMPLANHPGKQVKEPKIDTDHFITADGVLLPLRIWLPQDIPAKAVVIALHGFNDYSNAFNIAGEYLNRHGIACYAYDQRGFGRAPGRGMWAGSTAYTEDLSSFAREIRKHHSGLPLYIVGESMGGAVTIVATTGSNPPDVDGVILVAPAVWGRRTMPWYQRWLLAVSSYTFPWIQLTGKGLHISPSDNREMLRALGRDPLVINGTRIDSLYGLTNLMDEALSRADRLKLPTLVQYGRHDQVIPKKPMLQMLEKVPTTTRTAFYEQGYHMLLRDLQAEKPLADIVAWIADRTSRLPYGDRTW